MSAQVQVQSVNIKPWITSILLFLLLTVTLPVAGQYPTEFEAPALVSPSDGEITTVDTFPPLGIPTLTWRMVQDTIIYHLQIDSDPLFTSPDLLEFYTANTQFTPIDIEPFQDGTFYWRVRVEEPLPGSNFSTPFQFTKSWASATNKPSLVSPTDGAVLAFFEEDSFSWTAVSGAISYRFQIASSPDNFQSPIYSQDTAALAHQPNYKFPNGNYFWRVLPIDQAGLVGTPSTILAFSLAFGSITLEQTPDLLEPSHHSTQTFTPTFRWSAVNGAEVYRLEYASGPICDFSNATDVTTSQTSYTPIANLITPSLYCWRVRVESGLAVGDWSEIYIFTLNWDVTSRLLTPTDNYQYARTPIFSWTPVPGAAYYQIELTETSLQNKYVIHGESINPFWISSNELPPTQYLWQVTPFDYDDQAGTPSQLSAVQNPLTASVPSLIYPLHYYLPNDPSYYTSILLTPAEDRTTAYPLFVWNRVFNPAPFGGLYSYAYQLQVSLTPSFSQSVWEIITENTSATPTLDNPFLPLPDQDYYWRVCPYDPVLDKCLIDPNNGDILWSQIWIARFDSSLAPSPTEGDAPELVRPVQGHEQVEATPLLEWLPMPSAAYYQIQISRDQDFSTIENEAFPTIPLYASAISLAQRNLNRTDYGTFYWRVRAYIEENYSGWSETYRFQIASQSEWRRVRTLGELQNRLLVGDDPISDTSANYDLTTLYISQSDQKWYLGLNVNPDPIIDMTYAIYLDADHLDGSGGNVPPERPYQVSTIPAHLPEYVLYIDQINGNFSAQNIQLFSWNRTTWGYSQSLYALGGAVFYNPGSPGYLEIEIPDSAIDNNYPPDSLSVIVFSVNLSGIVMDTVPADPNVPGNALLTRLTSVSDRLNLVSPPSNVLVESSTISSMLPLYWDWPTGSDPSGSDYAPPNPFAGAQLQIAIDPRFTIIVADQVSESNAHYIGTSAATVSNDLVGDNTYYWRVRPRYLNAGIFFGAWSETYSFTRAGFTPGNLRVSSNQVTPEFRWDQVEGAAAYILQISTQADFDPLTLGITTPNPSFTPTSPLVPGTYYWRVGIIRHDLAQPNWSSIQILTLTLPAPSGLSPNDSTEPIHEIPTLCWQPVEVYIDDMLTLSAWKYRLQISKDNNFQQFIDEIDTEMHCWTPLSWYSQGITYWRVAMIDSLGHVGAFSNAATFDLQYPTSRLLSPVAGWIFQTPDFIWSPVPGMVSYRLEVSLEPDFYPLLQWVQTVNTQYTPLFIYPNDQIYYWRVAASPLEGFYGAYVETDIIFGSPRVWLPIVSK